MGCYLIILDFEMAWRVVGSLCGPTDGISVCRHSDLILQRDGLDMSLYSQSSWLRSDLRT